MKLTIKRGELNSCEYFSTYIDNKRCAPFQASRMLTDTTNEGGAGIFTDSSIRRDIVFYKESRKAVVSFGPLSRMTIPESGLQHTIRQRIDQVRTQIAMADWEEVVEMEINTR